MALGKGRGLAGRGKGEVESAGEIKKRRREGGKKDGEVGLKEEREGGEGGGEEVE